MTGVFFDNNVLIYALTKGDPRQAVAARLLQDSIGTISVQVLNEVASVAHRKLKLSWADIAETLADLRSLCHEPRALTLATHQAAVALAARHGFSFYDAPIVAAALEAGCTTLLTEDMQDGLLVEGRLTLHNPFRQGT